MFGFHKRQRNSSVTGWIVASKWRFFLHVLKFPGDLIQWNLLRGQLCRVIQIKWTFKGQACLHHQCSDMTQHVGYLDYMYNCTTLELAVECQGIGFMSRAWYCCAWLLFPLDNSLVCLSKLFTGCHIWLHKKPPLPTEIIEIENNFYCFLHPVVRVACCLAQSGGIVEFNYQSHIYYTFCLPKQIPPTGQDIGASYISCIGSLCFFLSVAQIFFHHHMECNKHQRSQCLRYLP
jgi:hypothetical protein